MSVFDEMVFQIARRAGLSAFVSLLAVCGIPVQAQDQSGALPGKLAILAFPNGTSDMALVAHLPVSPGSVPGEFSFTDESGAVLARAKPYLQFRETTVVSQNPTGGGETICTLDVPKGKVTCVPEPGMAEANMYDDTYKDFGIKPDGSSERQQSEFSGTTPAGLESGVLAIDVTDSYFCALKNDGKLYCWGWSSDYFEPRWQIDLSQNENERILDFSIFDDATVCVTRLSGVVGCRGWMKEGEGADVHDFWTNRNGGWKVTRPVSIDYGPYNTCALTQDGALKCLYNPVEPWWSEEGEDILPVPENPWENSTDIADFAMNWLATCVVSRAGAVSCIGNNVKGSLAMDPATVFSKIGAYAENPVSLHEDNTNAQSPVAIPTLSSGVTKIGGTDAVFCALKGTEVYCWGGDTYWDTVTRVNLPFTPVDFVEGNRQLYAVGPNGEISVLFSWNNQAAPKLETFAVAIADLPYSADPQTYKVFAPGLVAEARHAGATPQPSAPERIVTPGEMESHTAIAWKIDSGALNFWRFNDGHYKGVFEIADLPQDGRELVAIGDVDGDGHDDMVWKSKPGDDGKYQLSTWGLRAGKKMREGDVGDRLPPEWIVKGLGDANGDGTEDLFFWNNQTGEVYVWTLSNGNLTGKSSLGSVPVSEWMVGGVGDINADGSANIIWSKLSDGEVYHWEIKNLAKSSEGTIAKAAGGHMRVVGVDDVTGDGMDDIFFTNLHALGQVPYWKMKNGQREAEILVDSGKFPNWQIVAIGNIAPY